METDAQTCVCILRPNVGWLWLAHVTERNYIIAIIGMLPGFSLFAILRNPQTVPKVSRLSV
jgi:hypothetical protein